MIDEDELNHYKVKAQIVDYDEDLDDPYVVQVRTAGYDGSSQGQHKVSRRYTPEGALLIATADALGLDVDDVLDTDMLEDEDDF